MGLCPRRLGHGKGWQEEGTRYSIRLDRYELTLNTTTQMEFLTRTRTLLWFPLGRTFFLTTFSTFEIFVYVFVQLIP